MSSRGCSPCSRYPLSHLVKSLLRIRFVKAFNVLADLSAVASFPQVTLTHTLKSKCCTCTGMLPITIQGTVNTLINNTQINTLFYLITLMYMYLPTSKCNWEINLNDSCTYLIMQTTEKDSRIKRSQISHTHKSDCLELNTVTDP